MKNLYLIRGLPGSGKSRLARTLTWGRAPMRVDWFEADQYFMDGRKYKYDHTKIGDAHAECQGNVERAMVEGADHYFMDGREYKYDGDIPNSHIITVSNTFSQNWEMDPYKRMADEHGFVAVVVECQSFFKDVHGVPDSSIERMRARWEKNRTGKVHQYPPLGEAW